MSSCAWEWDLGFVLLGINEGDTIYMVFVKWGEGGDSGP